MKKYTVKQLAKLAGISPRTLRHYDRIDLLKPAFVGDNGYRYCQHDQLIKLMQILFYRELDFSLTDIKQIITNPNFDMTEALQKHRHLLNLKAKRTKRLIKTIDQILIATKGNQTISASATYQSFDQTDINQYKDEVKRRWGHTDAYRQSIERAKKWTKQDLDRIKQQVQDITLKLAKLIDQDTKSPRVQALIKQHHAHINNFYDCSIDIYRGLGEIYFADPRFAAHYNRVKPGLAEFINQAISYYCNQAANQNQ